MKDSGKSCNAGLIFLICAVAMSSAPNASSKEINDLVFIHHSVGQNWLDSGLHDALVAKTYVDERNDITYGIAVPNDKGRPASLGDVAGENTNICHWILWFNDYLGQVKQFDCADGFNRIIMFKSCFPTSDVWDEGAEPGDPFSEDQTLANYRSLYRHPEGPGQKYARDGVQYLPLEDVFAQHPEILFIPVTSPPLVYNGTDNANAHRARLFNNWLKNDWLSSYNKAHPTLKNVAVFDLFNILANADNAVSGPNRLKAAYGGLGDDSHPNNAANAALTAAFATGAGNFLDAAWSAFLSATTSVEASGQSPAPSEFCLEPNYPNPFNPSTTIRYRLPTSEPVRLSIWDTNGREVAVIAEGMQTEGVHEVVWHGIDGRRMPVSAGVYTVRLDTDSHHGTGKLLLLK